MKAICIRALKQAAILQSCHSYQAYKSIKLMTTLAEKKSLLPKDLKSIENLPHSTLNNSQGPKQQISQVNSVAINLNPFNLNKKWGMNNLENNNKVDEILMKINKQFEKQAEKKSNIPHQEPLGNNQNSNKQEIDSIQDIQTQAQQQQNNITNQDIIFESSKEEKPKKQIHTATTVQSPLQKLIEKVKEEMLHFWDSTKKTYNDYRFTRNLLSNKKIYKETYTQYELKEMRRIKKDAIKLIPFSFFLIVPMMEVLIPPYIFLFPNAFPTHFLPHDAAAKKRQQKKEKQKQAYERLIILLKQTIINNNKDKQLNMDSPEFKDNESLLQLIDANMTHIKRDLNVHSLNSDQLLDICNFLIMDFVSGTHIVQSFFKHIVNMPRYLSKLLLILVGSEDQIEWKHPIFTYQIKLNFQPFEQLKRKLLVKQILSQIQNLQFEDHSYQKFGLDQKELDQTYFEVLANERGLDIDDENSIKQFLVKFWLPQTQKIGVTKSQYFWYTVCNYKFKIEKITQQKL